MEEWMRHNVLGQIVAFFSLFSFGCVSCPFMQSTNSTLFVLKLDKNKNSFAISASSQSFDVAEFYVFLQKYKQFYWWCGRD